MRFNCRSGSGSGNSCAIITHIAVVHFFIQIIDNMQVYNCRCTVDRLPLLCYTQKQHRKIYTLETNTQIPTNSSTKRKKKKEEMKIAMSIDIYSKSLSDWIELLCIFSI